ncbi:hypothetical protein QCA50_008624 [Cerrena zonata]|uniref:Ricin B lectin domain-containing protein n=1 Tax=Cerrena zonata TaxID=2478898 RepID=A0AAW0GDX5_9APHY
MLATVLAKLAVIVIAAGGVIATSASAPPTPGKYTIQNVASGLFMDATASLQFLGNPVIVFPLNVPATHNQQWNVTVNSSGAFNLQSISSFVQQTTANGTTVVSLNPTTPSPFNIRPAANGVFICMEGCACQCFTGSSVSHTQITMEPLTGALNQSWVFQPVSS